jgi:sterol desaturase/sphingolipid hydroxylase (fatty acid hydroxylase superfamily)
MLIVLVIMNFVFLQPFVGDVMFCLPLVHMFLQVVFFRHYVFKLTSNNLTNCALHKNHHTRSMMLAFPQANYASQLSCHFQVAS